MFRSRTSSIGVSRRMLLQAATALVPAAVLFGLPVRGAAQDATAPAAPQPTPFSFDILTEQMRLLAGQPYEKSAPLTDAFLSSLGYDDYRQINFLPNRERWSDQNTPFRLAAFHMGWLFPEPVQLFDVQAGMATELLFSSDDFEYRNGLAARVPPHFQMPGVAGFRLTYPMNRPDLNDEIGGFLGASYFRFLGRASAYGLSARGLAVNCATATGEEFPRFSNFYLEVDRNGGSAVTVYATLEGPSVTGAYRFIITPGADTVMEVTARLFFRQDVAELGVAPLTSMFLFSEKNRADFDDYRPNVHDSDGLRILRRGGDELWRPLNNPKRLSGSYLAEDAPLRFGLHQRDRSFDSYQDTGAQYQRRPSLDVEPLGNWGKGAVRLVEIPSELEANDNIVAYWIPADPVKAGDKREFSYRLHWGDLPHDDNDTLAYVHETRAGHGGVAGVAAKAGERKFVVDFKGGILANLDATAQVQPVVSASGGEISGMTLEKVAGTDVWRLVLDITASEGAVVELSAHIAGYGRKLTEIWLYQWVNVK